MTFLYLTRIAADPQALNDYGLALAGGTLIVRDACKCNYVRDVVHFYTYTVQVG